MWGQVITYIQQLLSGGIIPTRVGTSKKDESGAWLKEDHPHACGDKELFRSDCQN